MVKIVITGIAGIVFAFLISGVFANAISDTNGNFLIGTGVILGTISVIVLLFVAIRR